MNENVKPPLVVGKIEQLGPVGFPLPTLPTTFNGMEVKDTNGKKFVFIEESELASLRKELEIEKGLSEIEIRDLKTRLESADLALTAANARAEKAEREYREAVDHINVMGEDMVQLKLKNDGLTERAEKAEVWIAGLPTIPDHMELRELEAWLVRYDEYVSCRTQKKKTPVVWCDHCDGCGWVEGGETLKTKCIKCGGTGRASRPKGE